MNIRRGLLAGILAGFLLALLNFVTDGTPGRTLPDALHWFGITIADPTISRFSGFFLLIVLGGLFGLIFGAVQGERSITLSRTLLSGLALGLAWWFVFSLVLANIMNHASSPFSLQFGGFLSTFPIDLLFGLVLGAIYFQLQQQHTAEAS
jgi:xanthosine utilization system XapX-like protein